MKTPMEQEARRLRARYVNDWTVRAAIAIDLAIRRVAGRLLSPFVAAPSRHSPSR